jgi:septum formation protein
MTNKIPFILASSSPRRKELIGHLKIPFKIMTKHVDEISHETDPVKFVADIASQKGQVVAESLEHAEGIIVSADTIVVYQGKIYGKPSGVEEARQFLSELAGNTHSVFTAVNIIKKTGNSFQTHRFVEESKVSFNTIPNYLMELYLATGDSLDKAGAYGIQGASLSFISKVEGDYANVVGFPLSRFVVEMEKFLGAESWLDQF